MFSTLLFRNSVITTSFVLLTVAIVGAPKQSLAQADRCNSPYQQVTGVGSPGNVPTDPTQGELTIQHANIGEPFVSCADNTITIVLKVNNLDPAGSGQAVLAANAEWKVNFAITDTNGAPENMFVALDTFAANGASPALPEFSYGRKDPTPTGTQEQMECFEQPPLFSCPQLTGSTFNKDGTVTFKVHVSTPLAFTAPAAPGTGVAFNWDGSAVGTQLKNVTANTVLLAGVFLENVQTTGTTGPTYTRTGNKSCGPIPIAGLTSSPSPATGAAPLSVTFDGSSSTDPNPCANLNSYSLNFGDGSPVATQSTPSFPPHIYNTANTYTASLIVGNDAGQVSTNPAQITVTVTSVQPPPLSGVVSRFTHGLVGDFDIDLPLTGTRGVECRTSSPAGNYQLVFTFVNALTSVGSVTVTTGSGSVGSNMISGSNPHRYIVNLTGVDTGQYIGLTLNNALDALGNSGNVVGPQMGVLIGDVNGNGTLSNADVSLVKAQVAAGGSVDPLGSNFRDDINANGVISNADVSLTKAQVAAGAALPSPP